MKCERCQQSKKSLRPVQCPDSRRPLTLLCLLCWTDLQIWLVPPSTKLVDTLLEGHDGEVDFVRPMGVR